VRLESRLRCRECDARGTVVLTDIPRISGRCEAKIVPLSVMAKRKSRSVWGKRRSKPPVVCAETLKRAALPASRRTSAVVGHVLMIRPALAEPGVLRRLAVADLRFGSWLAHAASWVGAARSSNR
jgi:hypothetical protein